MNAQKRLWKELDLYWDRTHLGRVVDVTWTDFPWATGKLIPGHFPPPLREVLEWFARVGEMEDLEDPPFADHLLKDWRLQSADGTTIEICVPIIDFDRCTIEWR